MSRIIQWLLNLRKETVASLTADLNNLAAKLNTVEQKAKAEVLKLEDEIAELLSRKDGHTKEAAAAKSVAANITNLVTPAATTSTDTVAKAA